MDCSSGPGHISTILQACPGAFLVVPGRQAFPDLLISLDLRFGIRFANLAQFKVLFEHRMQSKTLSISGALNDHFEVMHSSMRTTLVQAPLPQL